MPILAAMGDRESRRIAKAVGRAMHDFGDLGQCTDGSRTDTRHEQKLGEIFRPEVGRSRQSAVQTSGDDVLGPNIMMTGHDQVREHELSLRGRAFDRTVL